MMLMGAPSGGQPPRPTSSWESGSKPYSRSGIGGDQDSSFTREHERQHPARSKPYPEDEVSDKSFHSNNPPTRKPFVAKSARGSTDEPNMSNNCGSIGGLQT
jgi:hypothetical protein